MRRCASLLLLILPAPQLSIFTTDVQYKNAESLAQRENTRGSSPRAGRRAVDAVATIDLT